VRLHELPLVGVQLMRELMHHLTVMHELAHQLNADKWKFMQPHYASSRPAADLCTSTVEALQEGFATAIAAWAIYGEGETYPEVRWLSDSRKSVRTNLEAPDVVGPDLCPRGEEDHTWVSALFWDLLDYRSDRAPPNEPGSDTFNFDHPLAPFDIYLNPPEKGGEQTVWTDIRDFKERLKHNRNRAVKRQIDEIYLLNKMTPR